MNLSILKKENNISSLFLSENILNLKKKQKFQFYLK